MSHLTPLVGASTALDLEWRESVAQQIRESVSEGRTGANFPRITETLFFDEDAKVLEVRYDDFSNLEFWLQSRFPMRRLLDGISLETLKEYVKERECVEAFKTAQEESPDPYLEEFLENIEK